MILKTYQLLSDKIKRSVQMKNIDKDIRIKEDRPVLAICYDFDKTLSPDDMQAQGVYTICWL